MSLIEIAFDDLMMESIGVISGDTCQHKDLEADGSLDTRVRKNAAGGVRDNQGPKGIALVVYRCDSLSLILRIYRVLRTGDTSDASPSPDNTASNASKE